MKTLIGKAARPFKTVRICETPEDFKLVWKDMTGKSSCDKLCPNRTGINPVTGKPMKGLISCMCGELPNNDRRGR